MKKIIVTCSLSLFVLVMVQCSPKASKAIAEAPLATSEQMKAQFSVAQLEEGKVIWQNNCNKCHKLFAPESRDNEKWHKVLRRMIPRAKLSDEEGKLVRAYLIAYSKQG